MAPRPPCRWRRDSFCVGRLSEEKGQLLLTAAAARLSGENRWLFAAGSIEDMVDAMVKCLAAMPEDLSRMGNFSCERAVTQHSIETETPKLAELFRPQTRYRDRSV